MLNEIYTDYKPVFEYAQPPNLIKLSRQPGFYNRAKIMQDSRVPALIEAAKKREAEKDYREAIKHYQKIIQKFPESLIRVSDFGVYVPAVLYVQHRMLTYPSIELKHYRTLFDAEAKDVYERAKAGHSLEGLHDVADFFLATSYGAKALVDLGKHALDVGHFEAAVHYFEEIRLRHPRSDYNIEELSFNLAYAYKRLGHVKDYQKMVAGIRSGGNDRLGLLNKLKPLKNTTLFAQTKHPKHLSFSDFKFYEPLISDLSQHEYQWNINLPGAQSATQDDQPSGGELLPFHRPWVAGNSLYFKHYNRIYCYSLISGEKRWSFDLGPTDRLMGQMPVWHRKGGTTIITGWKSDEDILVDGELVYANVEVFGRRASLVALDRVTGQMRWAAGPAKPLNEEDLRTRYDGAPALGRHVVFAPWSYDEGEGSDNLYTSAGITAFDKHTGQVLWKKTLCQLEPTATTQSRSKIRIRSATPLVQGGVVYHTTNAGVIAALDEVSGMVRWLVRYPHVWNSHSRNGSLDGHDDIKMGAGAPGMGPHFSNQSPLLYKNRLYIMPTDGDHFLCVDKQTGKILWNKVLPSMQYLVGISREGNLILAGSHRGVSPSSNGRIEILDPLTGNSIWSFSPKYRITWFERGQYVGMRFLNRPTLTRDNRLYFSAFAAPRIGSGYHGSSNPVYSEWCLSLKDRKLVNYRMYTAPRYRLMQEGRIRIQIKNQKNFIDFVDKIQPKNVNSPRVYDPVKRLPFKLHGVSFEIATSGNRIWCQFDRARLEQSVAGGKTARELFTLAEIMLVKGEEKQAITLYEQCKDRVKPEEKDFLREIDRELYRLYLSQAWKSLLAADKPSYQKRTNQMGQTATTVTEEVQSLFALSESFERQGNIAKAVKCLQNVIRHYPDTIFAVSSTTLKSFAGREGLINTALTGLGQKKPLEMESQFQQLEKLFTKSSSDFFSAVTPIDPDVKAEAEKLAISRLNGVLGRHQDFKKTFESWAEKSLKQNKLKSRFHELTAYPGTKAAQSVLAEMHAEGEKMPPAERQRHGWQLSDLATRLSLTLPAKLSERDRLAPWRDALVSMAGPLTEKIHKYDDGGQVLRLPLKVHGQVGKSHLLFIGGRARQKIDNKFMLECRELITGKEVWKASEQRGKSWFKEIRLKGKGDEAGFAEVFLSGDLVITHGQFDILAFDLSTGKLKWRFRVPFDFDLRSVSLAGELLVLSGSIHSMGLQVTTGDVAWHVEEIGELYSPPYLRDGILISVRREPFGVVFRRLGSGKLVRFLAMPDLNLSTRHPVLASDISRGAVKAGISTDILPIACKGNLLMLTDGIYYIAVDIRDMMIRWKRPIDNNDIGTPPIRYFIHEPYLLVLKRDFTVPALYLLDSRTGKILWQTKDIVYSIWFDDHGNTFYGLAAPKTSNRVITLMAFDTKTRKIKHEKTWEGFNTAPDGTLVGQYQGGKVVVRIIHGETMELAVMDMKGKNEVGRFNMKGVGEFGVHGGKSTLVQGKHLIFLNPEQYKAVGSK